MANTWTAVFQSITFDSNKSMAAILNGGARVLRIRRIRFLQTQISAVAGVLCYGQLRRYLGASISGQTPITPVPHDSTNSALSSVTCATGGTITYSSYENLRQYVWSSDEMAAGGATVDEWQSIVPLNIFWEAGFGSSTFKPLVLREDEMISIYNLSGSVGSFDVYITFTDEES